jgi:hypothetical protein
VQSVPIPYGAFGANAFDVQHLATVHRRVLAQPAEVVVVSQRRIRIRYVAGVRGTGWYDALTRFLGVRETEIEIECWGGTQLVFHHRRMAAFTLLATRPLDDETTRVYLCTGRSRSLPSSLLRPLDAGILALHHWLILTFVLQDLRALEGFQLRPGALLPDKDAELAAWYRHFQAVPRASVPE